MDFGGKRNITILGVWVTIAAGWGTRLGTSFASKWAEVQGQTWHQVRAAERDIRDPNGPGPHPDVCPGPASQAHRHW